ncbi:hypothetical protein CY35_19G057900 [Sphagnum magellanicum]|nr:hypothetical protein CY35_19G057900 [Sphagnum magellanicum]
MVMAIVVNSNVVAASRQYPGGRSLLQSHGALLIDYMGASGYRYGNSQNVNRYDPASTTDWVNNAVSSISSLVSTYNLDEVDVDYENFPTGSATFTTCIGQLISNLKSAATISVASIAPFGSTSSIYADLFSNYGSSIDYVNYQFYADVSASFDPTKLLASVEVNGPGLQGNDFIAAAQQLSIAGVMNFDVDNSKSSNFALEQSVATFLTS